MPKLDVLVTRSNSLPGLDYLFTYPQQRYHPAIFSLPLLRTFLSTARIAILLASLIAALHHHQSIIIHCNPYLSPRQDHAPYDPPVHIHKPFDYALHPDPGPVTRVVITMVSNYPYLYRPEALAHLKQSLLLSVPFSRRPSPPFGQGPSSELHRFRIFVPDRAVHSGRTLQKQNGRKSFV